MQPLVQTVILAGAFCSAKPSIGEEIAGISSQQMLGSSQETKFRTEINTILVQGGREVACDTVRDARYVRTCTWCLCSSVAFGVLKRINRVRWGGMACACVVGGQQVGAAACDL